MKNGILILGLIFGLLLLNSSKPYTNCSDSPKTRLDSLMSKKWNSEFNRIQYHKDTMVSIENLDMGRYITFKNVYYLTDDISKMGIGCENRLTNFDWSKVGKSVEGKFLVTLFIRESGNEKYGVCRLYEIVELTDNKLVLRYASHTGEWVAAPDMVYKAEPLD